MCGAKAGASTPRRSLPRKYTYHTIALRLIRHIISVCGPPPRPEALSLSFFAGARPRPAAAAGAADPLARRRTCSREEASLDVGIDDGVSAQSTGLSCPLSGLTQRLAAGITLLP